MQAPLVLSLGPVERKAGGDQRLESGHQHLQLSALLTRQDTLPSPSQHQLHHEQRHSPACLTKLTANPSRSTARAPVRDVGGKLHHRQSTPRDR